VESQPPSPHLPQFLFLSLHCQFFKWGCWEVESRSLRVHFLHPQLNLGLSEEDEERLHNTNGGGEGNNTCWFVCKRFCAVVAAWRNHKWETQAQECKLLVSTAERMSWRSSGTWRGFVIPHFLLQLSRSLNSHLFRRLLFSEAEKNKKNDSVFGLFNRLD